VQIVPALIGVILNMTMVIFTAAAIVRERERGNLELLITTPIRPGAHGRAAAVGHRPGADDADPVRGSLLFDAGERLPAPHVAAALSSPRP
jgi:hypothetical protein